MGGSIWNILFPERCAGCGSWGKLVCEKCEIGMGEADQICPGCGKNSLGGATHPYCRKLTVLEGLTCMWEYEGIVKKLIGEGKYGLYYENLKRLVQMRKLGKNEAMSFWKFVQNKPCVVPVPLYAKRQRERGFNQAEIIGKTLALQYRLALISNWLERIKDTGRQVGRSRPERLLAMKGAFRINPKLSFDCAQDSQKSVNILLVDDVWTTGTTMREGAETLKKAGVGRIWGFTLAR